MTKKELEQKCKDIAQNNMFEFLRNEDKRWLLENIFCYHPDWEWFKQNGRILGVKAELNKEKYGTLCFYIYYKDGSKVDISYKKCIKNIKIQKS